MPGKYMGTERPVYDRRGEVFAYYGCVNTPAGVLPFPFLALLLCGAESVPRKNLPLLLTTASNRARRS